MIHKGLFRSMGSRARERVRIEMLIRFALLVAMACLLLLAW